MFENGSITLTNLVYPHLTIVIRYDYSSAMAIHLNRTFNRSVKFAITDDLAHFLIVSPVILVEEQREQWRWVVINSIWISVAIVAIRIAVAIETIRITAVITTRWIWWEYHVLSIPGKYKRLNRLQTVKFGRCIAICRQCNINTEEECLNKP